MSVTATKYFSIVVVRKALFLSSRNSIASDFAYFAFPHLAFYDDLLCTVSTLYKSISFSHQFIKIFIPV